MKTILYIVPTMRHAEGCAFARRPEVVVVSAGITRPFFEIIVGYQVRAIVIHPDTQLRAEDWFHLQSCCPPLNPRGGSVDWRISDGESIHTEDLFA